MRRYIAWMIWLHLAFAATGAAQPAVYRVLIVRSNANDLEPDNSIIRILRTELSRRSSIPIDFFDVSLQPTPTSESIPEEPVLRYLQSALGGRRLDLVITASGPAARFAQKYRAQLFPSTPLLWSCVDRRWLQDAAATPNTAAVAVDLAPHQAIVDILRVRPDTTTVFAVLGHSSVGAFWADTMRRELEPLKDRVALVVSNDMSFAEILQRSAALPQNSAIFYMELAIDARGFVFSEQRVLAELHQVANAPMYGLFSTQLGQGIVGGPLFSVENVATDTANVAMRLLQGEPAGTIRSPSPTQDQPRYDWRELRKWGISEARLPPGSMVLFREPSLWDRYKLYVLAAIVVFVLQSVLIGGLVLQRARRRRSELALREQKAALRESYEQNRDLAGRLIDAQEMERTRIARDLHDDVIQQLAGVGITLSGLKRELSRPDGSHAEETVTALQKRTSTLVDTVRHLSHELHPGVLQHAGLVAALTQHCADVERLHGVKVTVNAQEDLDSLTADVALCLYRVTQEALTNVIRHARARAVRVGLSRTGPDVELSVVDDGVGFVTGERIGSGLGLRSIDERVRLAAGHVAVDSRPGHGTSLVVRIPLSPALAAAGEA